MLLGIAQRALVITEPCSIAPPFVANVDYVEAPLDELPDRIEYFLKSSAGQNEAQRIVDHGFDTLTNRCRLADVLKPLIDQLTVRPMQSEGARFFPATQAGVVAERPLSICVVTPNVTGDGPNAENGSSQIFLAESLAVAGHRVTLLDTAVEPTTGQSLGQRTKDFAARGLNYVALPSNRQAPVESSEACQRSYETYLWLREKAFQVVHFPEPHGIGFYSLMAHRQGLELGETKFCVHAHQPTLWKRQAEQKLVNNISDLELDHMEAECFRLAPALAVTTTAMLRWLERQNFSLPAQRAIRPFAPTTVSRARSGEKPTELVYLGPLSRCPGLTMFCAALERLNPEAARNVKVIFAGNTEGADSQVGDFMPARLQNQKAGWEVVLKKSDDLFEFVQGTGRMIVMPSPMDNAPEFLRQLPEFWPSLFDRATRRLRGVNRHLQPCQMFISRYARGIGDGSASSLKRRRDTSAFCSEWKRAMARVVEVARDLGGRRESDSDAEGLHEATRQRLFGSLQSSRLFEAIAGFVARSRLSKF